MDYIDALPDGVRAVVLPGGSFAAEESGLPLPAGPLTLAAGTERTDIVVGLINDEKGCPLQHRLGHSSFAAAVADVPAGPGGTFSARAGDWFAWLSVGPVPVALAGLRKSRNSGLS